MSSHVKVRLVSEKFIGEFFFRGDQVGTGRSLLKDGFYRDVWKGHTLLQGADAAEEMFDLTNNPSRQDERVEKYGKIRSVSVGDIVQVNGADYLCTSQGWEDLS